MFGTPKRNELLLLSVALTLLILSSNAVLLDSKHDSLDSVYMVMMESDNSLCFVLSPWGVGHVTAHLLILVCTGRGGE